MPKKPSPILVMSAYPPLSSRRGYGARVEDVGVAGKTAVRVEFAIVGEPLQAGRTIVHEVPAILAPNSPLCVFLLQGFGIVLKQNESFDLTKLVGRSVELRFAKGRDGEEPTIVGIKRSEQPVPPPKLTSSPTRGTETERGLG